MQSQSITDESAKSTFVCSSEPLGAKMMDENIFVCLVYCLQQPNHKKLKTGFVYKLHDNNITLTAFFLHTISTALAKSVGMFL